MTGELSAVKCTATASFPIVKWANTILQDGSVFRREDNVPVYHLIVMLSGHTPQLRVSQSSLSSRPVPVRKSPLVPFWRFSGLKLLFNYLLFVLICYLFIQSSGLVAIRKSPPVFFLQPPVLNSNSFHNHEIRMTSISPNNHWWLIRITLLVAFRFLSQSFGRWQGPTYIIL